MKKIVSLLLALSILLMLLSACSVPGEKPSTGPSVYEVLEVLANKDYSVVKIDVVTKTSFAELSASYTLKQDRVAYSVEQLNELSASESTSALPADYKTTVTGSAKIENGKVVSLDGAGINLPSYDELKGSFHFSEENFKNVVEGEKSFSADVVSPSAFYGATVNVSDLKISAMYSESALSEIAISYKTAGAKVETVYTFES